MTVLSELSKIAYIGSSSQTLYPIPFEYINTDDVKVSIYTSNNEFVEDWTYSIQYVIEGGNVKVLSGYNIDNTKKLLILRSVDLIQDNKYREGGDFPAKSTETSFDKLTMITQQLQETLDRCVKVDVLDIQTPEELLQTVYDKLDSATVIAGDAISAANQAQTAADNATAAVNSAEQTLVQTQAYVDSAKVEIDNTKNTAINTINSTVSTAKGDIANTVVSAKADITNTADNATSEITSTVAQAKSDVNSAIDEATTNISDTSTSAINTINSVKDSATSEINSAVSSAETEITSTKNTAINTINTDVSNAESNISTIVSNAEGSITNTKNTAINTINTAVSNAESNISTIVSDAEGSITNTKNAAISTINTAVSNAESNISTIVSDAEGSITNIAVTEANKAIANAAQEATDTAKANLNNYVDGTVKPSLQTYVDQAQADANSAATSMQQAALSATAASNYASNASADADNAAESAGLAANSAALASADAGKAANSAELAQQIKDSLGSVYVYKGSVNSYSDLPDNATTGDVYNVVSNGKNYAWTGSEWDDLGGTVDLSEYQKTADADSKYATKASLNSLQGSKQDISNLSQTLDDSTTKYPSNKAVKTAIDAKDSLPSQAGNNGKFLTTNGTNPSWQNVDALPSQSGQSGKFLTTNGTTASWGDVFSAGNIGDIKYTSRTDVPNGGAWCDGALYTKAQFPDVYQMLVDGKLQSTTISEFDSSVSANGSCGFFGLDTANERFKVPMLKDVYLKAGQAGEMFGAESLPNITGDLKYSTYTQSDGTTGAFSKKSGSGTAASVQFNDYGVGSVNFDASRSSSTYKDGAKVNPDHVVYRAYVVLYSSAAEASVAQAAEFMTAIDGKANADLSNLSAAGRNAVLSGVAPSSRQISVSLGPQAYFQSPANGYIQIGLDSKDIYGQVLMFAEGDENRTTPIFNSGIPKTVSSSVRGMFYIGKGQIFVYNSPVNGTVNFIYALGEK